MLADVESPTHLLSLGSCQIIVNTAAVWEKDHLTPPCLGIENELGI